MWKMFYWLLKCTSLESFFRSRFRFIFSFYPLQLPMANPTGNFLTFPKIFFYQFLKIAVLSTLMYNFSIHICTYIWSICIESPVNADIFIRFTPNDRTVLRHFLKFTIYSFTITPLYSHNNIASVFLFSMHHVWFFFVQVLCLFWTYTVCMQ